MKSSFALAMAVALTSLLVQPAFAASCKQSVGAKKAKLYETQCRRVSPATRPPCNPINDCEMIIGEIKRGCDMLDQTSRPAYCAQYQ